MALFLAAIILSSYQDSDVDRILVRFKQRATQAKSDTQVKQALLQMRSELEQFLKEKPKDKDAHRAA